jgi:hypothetical protein
VKPLKEKKQARYEPAFLGAKKMKSLDSIRRITSLKTILNLQ